MISVADPVFQDLQVWVDSNHDGQSQQTELIHLTDLKIASLDLKAQVSTSLDQGNLLGLISHYTSIDGTQHRSADVWLQVSENTSSKPEKLTQLSPLALPEQIVSVSRRTQNLSNTLNQAMQGNPFERFSTIQQGSLAFQSQVIGENPGSPLELGQQKLIDSTDLINNPLLNNRLQNNTQRIAVILQEHLQNNGIAIQTKNLQMGMADPSLDLIGKHSSLLSAQDGALIFYSEHHKSMKK